MKINDVANIIEAILFVSDVPVVFEDLQHILDGVSEKEIVAALEKLGKNLKDRSLELVEIAEGYQLRTKAIYAEEIKRFHKLEQSTRLSPASLEVLSIIAYKQPMTRQDIEDIRGVDSSSIVKRLLDKGLIKSMGRKKIAGKPMTFGTTSKFLEYFGLVKLSDLPTLKDIPDDVDGEIAQAKLEFQQKSGSAEKSDADIQLEEESAMIEPAEEDYEDELDEEKLEEELQEG